MSDALPVIAALFLAAALLVMLVSIIAAPGKPKPASVIVVSLVLMTVSLTLNLVHVLWFSPSIGYMLYLLIPALVLTLGSLTAIIVHSQRKRRNP